MSSVLIVDDHHVVSAGVKMVVKDVFKEIRSIDSLDKLLVELKKNVPDLLILDAEFEGSFSITKLRSVRLLYPDLKIIIYTSYNSLELCGRYLNEGVKGYILKSTPLEELERGIKSVMQGRVFMDSIIAAKMMEMRFQSERRLSQLSPREYEVFLQIAAGVSYKTIAKGLNLTVGTVGTYRTRIGEKLGLSSSEEIRQFAQLNGLLEK
ncbi:MAG: response regulator transcription factor [Flavobacteriia bacterium]|nr:response regulator transcription factor [Flavobacteriia bacterium]